MDLKYHNNRDKYIKVLYKWISHVIDAKEWDKIDDIHIDEIDTLFSKRELWFDGSLYLYNLACDLIDKSMYDCLLSIPLRDGRKLINAQKTNITVSYIKNRIHCMTPPSIYIFKKNDTNYNMTLLRSRYLEKLSKQLKQNVCFSEKENYPKVVDRYILIL